MDDNKNEAGKILSELDINKIKAEELLKYKIRKELDNEKGNGLWKWLNSPILLLIFSAGILSALSQVITASIQNAKDENEFKKAARIHLIELDNRIAELDRITSLLSAKYDTVISYNIGFIANGDSTGNYKASSPEFQRTSLLSIIAWFRINSKKTGELSKAYEATKTIPSLRNAEWVWDIPRINEVNEKLKDYRNQLNEQY